jgi:hypothetical protein
MRGTWNWLVLTALLAIPPAAGAQQVRSHAGGVVHENGPFGPIPDLRIVSFDGATLTLEWLRPLGNNGTFSHYDLYYSTSGPITKANQNQATLLRDFWVDASPDHPDDDMGTLENAPFAETATYHLGLTYWVVVQGVEGPEYTQIEFSNDVTIDVDVTPPAAVTALTATGMSESTLRLSWPAPGDDGTQGTATSYEFRYATEPPSGDSEAWWVTVADPLPAVPPVPATPGTIQEILLTTLNPDTHYYFAFRTTDDHQLVSSLSNIAEGSTSLRDPGTSSGASVPKCAGSTAGFAGGAAALLLPALLAARIRSSATA